MNFTNWIYLVNYAEFVNSVDFVDFSSLVDESRSLNWSTFSSLKNPDGNESHLPESRVVLIFSWLSRTKKWKKFRVFALTIWHTKVFRKSKRSHSICNTSQSIGQWERGFCTCHAKTLRSSLFVANFLDSTPPDTNIQAPPLIQPIYSTCILISLYP